MTDEERLHVTSSSGHTAVEISSDESGYEGETLIGLMTDVFSAPNLLQV